MPGTHQSGGGGTPTAPQTTYTPTNTGNWAGAAPTSQQDFNNRVAAWIKLHDGQPVPE